MKRIKTAEALRSAAGTIAGLTGQDYKQRLQFGNSPAGIAMLLRIYALTAIVLALKMSAISLVQGRARVAAGIFTNPEDAKAFGGQLASAEVPMVERAARAWRNDLENIPIFLIIGWIYVDAGLSVRALVIYCIVFMAARITHTVCYLNAIQPARTLAFTAGALTTLAMIIHLFIAVVV